MRRFILYAVFLALSAITPMAASDVKTVEGSFTFYGDDSHSKKDCDRMALEGARLNALAKAFGTVLSQSTMSDLRTDNHGEQNAFTQISETDVKGEWLEDIGEPKFTRSIDDEGHMIVTCKVKGRARAISNEAPEFVAEVLRNGNTRGQSGTTFHSGDQMALYVQAPVDGYLVVYLIGEDRTAYSLLPYMGSSDGHAKIKHGREYVFFDLPKADPAFGQVDEILLSTDSPVEYNRLYVIFSPKPFTKAPDTYNGEGIPRSLPFNEFYSWLGKARRNDASLASKVFDLTINAN